MLTHEELLQAIPHALQTVDLPSEWGTKEIGKVRDIYQYENKRVLITTDRVSAFDRVLGLIPYKGQVLNSLSGWWMQTANQENIVKNHLLDIPDPNVTIAKEAQVLPVEVIVRGYITGVTSTSLWTLYEKGERNPYGISLPDGLKKNDPLPQPIITPTTKAERGQHDERLTRTEILEHGLVEKKLWEQIESVAIALFNYGQKIAQQAELILVDTKYEFGLDEQGELLLIDEVHTPDSSRYWTQESYQQGEPTSIDKEFLRKWFAKQGYKGEGTPPTMPDEFIAQVAARYITVYEKLTRQEFVPSEQPAAPRVTRNLEEYRLKS